MKGFLNCGIGVPKLVLGDPAANAEIITELIKSAKNKDISLLVLPQLCLTGVSCGDLFFQDILIEKARLALQKLAEFTQGSEILILIGTPLLIEEKLYNVMAALYKGAVVGIVPKNPVGGENRHFSSWNRRRKEINLFEYAVPISQELVFSPGIQIVGDKTPQNTAPILVNPWGGEEVLGKTKENLAPALSEELSAAYIYVSPGMWESTTDLVYSGKSFIAENGEMLIYGKKYSLDTVLSHAVIDLDILKSRKRNFAKFKVDLPLKQINPKKLNRYINPLPFVKEESLREILEMQKISLARRLLHTSKKAVLGVSGGVDSALALIATKSAFEFLNANPKDIIAVTMPGFGTSETTYNNAKALITACGVSFREISIVPALKQHFADIGQDINNHDITYENAQARERTQILMDIANMEKGLVVGSGNFSEIALGFSTYNGDHMSMYNVNASLPKTLIIALLEFLSEKDEALGSALKNILNTPISPELLPAANGEISQKTEEIIGSYELNDFFLYQMLKYNLPPKKITELAQRAFNLPVDVLKSRLREFYKRFFTSQYKRSCSPDGARIPDISLSPRGGFVMPSDIEYHSWLKELD